MSRQNVVQYQDRLRTAKTLPPPPDAYDHIMARARSRRALSAQLAREADELERAAKLLKGHHP